MPAGRGRLTCKLSQRMGSVARGKGQGRWGVGELGRAFEMPGVEPRENSQEGTSTWEDGVNHCQACDVRLNRDIDIDKQHGLEATSGKRGGIPLKRYFGPMEKGNGWSNPIPTTSSEAQKNTPSTFSRSSA